MAYLEVTPRITSRGVYILASASVSSGAVTCHVVWKRLLIDVSVSANVEMCSHIRLLEFYSQVISNGQLRQCVKHIDIKLRCAATSLREVGGKKSSDILEC